ncbi:hypothetical protein GQ53DRAFT_179998 [Thozetella sp. PMI_491]|nr:hypothetical protein GQ53DRAFT_179998 [Thozetella sp. PMI_491]
MGVTGDANRDVQITLRAWLTLSEIASFVFLTHFYGGPALWGTSVTAPCLSAAFGLGLDALAIAVLAGPKALRVRAWGILWFFLEVAAFSLVLWGYMATIRSHHGLSFWPGEPPTWLSYLTNQRWVSWATIAMLLQVPIVGLRTALTIRSYLSWRHGGLRWEETMASTKRR